MRIIAVHSVPATKQRWHSAFTPAEADNRFSDRCKAEDLQQFSERFCKSLPSACIWILPHDETALSTALCVFSFSVDSWILLTYDHTQNQRSMRISNSAARFIASSATVIGAWWACIGKCSFRNATFHLLLLSVLITRGRITRGGKKFRSMFSQCFQRTWPT